MNYQKLYDSLMDKAKNENRKKDNEGIYYERHHIKPMFLFKGIKRKRNSDQAEDPNHKDNIVLLTFREHLLAHILLTKIYENTSYHLASVNSINLMLVNDNASHKRLPDVLKIGIKNEYYKRRIFKKTVRIKERNCSC